LSKINNKYVCCDKCDENQRNEYGDRCQECVSMAEKVQALKLLELVKERLKGAVKCGHKRFSDESGYLEQELQSLIEESEK